MAHILVIDSEPVLRATWRYLFEGCGYEVFAVANGPDGVQLCRGHAPELVILDVESSREVGDGFSTIETLRMEAPEVPILVLSPWSLDREEALDRGATVCVSKPVDYSTILKLADIMVSRAAARRWAALAGRAGQDFSLE